MHHGFAGMESMFTLQETLFGKRKEKVLQQTLREEVSF